MYDGDLPADERRRIEQQFLQDVPPGKTIIGTSALELGIDLPDLDLVVMDQLPLRRHELLQRLGRVGRRVGAPGLGILCSRSLSGGTEPDRLSEQRAFALVDSGGVSAPPSGPQSACAR